MAAPLPHPSETTPMISRFPIYRPKASCELTPMSPSELLGWDTPPMAIGKEGAPSSSKLAEHLSVKGSMSGEDRFDLQAKCPQKQGEFVRVAVCVDRPRYFSNCCGGDGRDSTLLGKTGGLCCFPRHEILSDSWIYVENVRRVPWIGFGQRAEKRFPAILCKRAVEEVEESFVGLFQHFQAFGVFYVERVGNISVAEWPKKRVTFDEVTNQTDPLGPQFLRAHGWREDDFERRHSHEKPVSDAGDPEDVAAGAEVHFTASGFALPLKDGVEVCHAHRRSRVQIHLGRIQVNNDWALLLWVVEDILGVYVTENDPPLVEVLHQFKNSID